MARKSTPSVLLGLGCLSACSVLLSRTAFVTVGSTGRAATAVYSTQADVPLPSFGREPLRHSSSTFAAGAVGAAVALAGVIAVTTRGTHRAARLARRVVPLVQSYPRTVVSKEEGKKWFDGRCSAITSIYGWNDEEFEESVVEQHFLWKKMLIPDGEGGEMRAERAVVKRNLINRLKGMYKTLRHFQPLAMQYPHLAMVQRTKPGLTQQTLDVELDAGWYINEEKRAGFTYEDLAKETNGGKYDKEGWFSFKKGDIAEGVVVGFSWAGAFVDVGDKMWAFMPTAKCCLEPIASATEVFSIGDKITAEVVGVGRESMIPRNPLSKQIILSRREMQFESTWEEIEAIFMGEEGTSPLVPVTVLAMRPWGAVCVTKSGLPGYIPNFELADKVGDTGMVGRALNVEIMLRGKDKAKAESSISSTPSRPDDFGLMFSYKNAATKELAELLEEGQVVEGVITAVRPGDVDILVDGYQCSVRKVDVSSSTKSYELENLFKEGEKVKAYVLSVLKKDGAVRLSFRALEAKKGQLLENKAKVFENAEKAAAMYFQRREEEKKKTDDSLDALLGDVFSGSSEDSVPKKTKKTVDIEDLGGDDDIGF
mmetsp:Transcript_177422/g.568967  ORF Transcript_177422/g.568967 Transcript_177422/m.568967 type:complete len:596 (-) Transcript_177422:281-2068(-)